MNTQTFIVAQQSDLSGRPSTHAQGSDSSSPSNPIDYSIVIPLFNEAESLEELTTKIKDALDGKSYEILFVDDGSKDDSWQMISTLRDADRERIKGIRHRRNFGKAEALSSGFSRASGKIVVTLDADLQDDPNEILNLTKRLDEGFDMVSGWKKKRYDPLSKTLPSSIFNGAARIVSGLSLHDFNCGIKAFRSEVLDQIDLYGELHRFIPILAHAEGFRVTEQAVLHHPRKHGNSKYGWKRLFKGGLDLLTVVLLTRYLQRPAHFFGGIGIAVGALGTLTLTFLSTMKILFNQNIGTRPLFFLGILSLLLGTQLVSTGIIGEFILNHRRRNKKESEINKRISNITN